MAIQLGDLDYPAAQTAIFFILILSLIFNVFLFKRGQGNYSIKYELMRTREFFRKFMFFTYVIEVCYKFFFALPFILLIVLSIMAAIRSPYNLAPILINGLIIILMLYPSKTQYFYYKLLIIFLLVLGSQLSTFFIYQKGGDQTYYILSVIFYTGNVMFFFLALVSIQKVYWQISYAVKKHPQEVSQVNNTWATQKLPHLFDGGLYGYFCKNPRSYLQFLILYMISLVFLALYAFLVSFTLKSNLGIVGLVSALIYDIFVQIFNSLENKGRTLKNVFIVLVASRFLSFIFGIQNWLLGYCVLYFGVAIFIGQIIIDKHFPMKQKIIKPDARKKFLNAFKTPEFALFALTLQVVIMILVQAYAITDADPTISYNNVSIPIWQWGVLAIVGAWVVIIYLLSVRVLMRHRSKIFTLTEYYFGVSFITEYHIYLFTSYLLLIALGLYAYFYLTQKLVLISFIFLPLIYFCLLGAGVAWSNNQYDILADTDEYNKLAEKKHNAKIKKQKMMSMNQKFKDVKKNMMFSTLKKKNSATRQSGFFGAFKGIASNVVDAKYQQDQMEQQSANEKDPQLSGNNLNPGSVSLKQVKYSQKNIPNENKSTFVPLRNWRSLNQNIKLGQIWDCLTPNDKKLLTFTILLLLLLIGYCLASILWSGNKFGISLTVCLISFLTLLPYYKFIKTKQNMIVQQILGNWIGFAIGIVYWSVFNSQVVGPIAFSLCYFILSLYLLINCYKTQLSVRVLISPVLQILICIIFIQITFAIHRGIIEPVVFGLIFFILIVLQIPLFFKLVKQYIPDWVMIVCSLLIGGAVIGLSVAGYVKGIISSFAIFSVIMFLIFISFFAAAVTLYLYKKQHQAENPNIYSAYGEPHYRFQSGKQVLKSNNNHLVVFSFSMTTLVVFSVIVSVFFNEKQWAVFGLALFWLTQFFVQIQVAIDSYLYIGFYYKKGTLTDDIIMGSFNKLKDHYMSDQIAGDDSSQFLQRLLKSKQKAKQTNDPEDWKEVVVNHDLYFKNIKEEERFLFYWTGLIIFNLRAKKRELYSKTIAELMEISDELQENGIIIQSLDSSLKPKQKYQKAMKEIQSLQPIDFILYEQILNNHREQCKRKAIEAEQVQKKQKQEQNKRDEQLFMQMNQQKHVDSNSQITKFQQLIKSLGKKNLFFDEEFPANQNSLGESLSSTVASWRRPNVAEMLTKGGITPDDVKQGNIGDCYLISSFGVLGQKRIKQAFGYDENGIQKWTNTKGAYMIKFYKFSQEKYVIIDDLLPVNDQDEWIFAKSEDPSEYWPCILQKAYAKLYGGYHKIVEGKCHQVLSEFSGGFPYEIYIDEYKSNPNGLWNRIITSKNNGYLLAAGSPPSPQGDTAISKRGINQGHAYSVLDAKEVDEYRLIKLKNPHGSAGREWTGDFSDKSDLMTKRVMGLLGHVRCDDGIFWMSIEDFIIQFKSLYICAVFDERWKKFPIIQGEWTDENSFGTPNNIGAENNPQFGLTVTKKCTFFISLSQQPISALKGKNPIYMKALRNDGKRISPESMSSEKSVGRPARPTNAVTISTELQLEANEYPYTFSLIVTCHQPGSTGKFTLEAYCDDKNSSIIQDADFDRKK